MVQAIDATLAAPAGKIIVDRLEHWQFAPIANVHSLFLHGVFPMSYYFAKTLDKDFDTVINDVTEALKQEGFGILTEIDVSATLKKKIDVDFRKYRILGACNPPYAYKALSAEDKIGAMLPCNVIVQQLDNGKVEVAAIDPIASMISVENPALAEIATEIQGKLKKVIDSLS